jgi:hypothetical protein
MSKTVITADMVSDPNSPLIGMTLVSDADGVHVGQVFDDAEDAEVIKSLRLPKSLYNTAVSKNHPQGFSGVVRDALQEYLNLKPSKDDVEHALRVITAVLSRAA